MIGQTFGRWVVTASSSKKTTSGVRYWGCKCVCGTERQVIGSALRNGQSKGCGCIVTTRAVEEHGTNYVSSRDPWYIRTANKWCKLLGQVEIGFTSTHEFALYCKSIAPDVCPILGVPLINGPRNHPNNYSIDRILPHLGYVRGNIQIISYRANRIKNDATLEELVRIGQWATSQLST